MSPAAVHIHSPFSLHNNPNPTNTTSSDSFSRDNRDDHHRGYVFGTAAFDAQFDSQGGARTRSGRARPRLVKVRKQLHGRCRPPMTGELGPGFNPFGSGCVDSDANGITAASSNESVNKSREIDDRCFVFGAAAAVNSNIENTQGSEGERENGKGSNRGSDFGVDLGLRLKMDTPVAGESVEKLEEPDFSKDEGIFDSGFVFGASWFEPATNLDEKTEESGESHRNSLLSDDARKIEPENQAGVDGISDELRKLKIDDFVSVGRACDEKSSGNADNLFVFGSKKTSACSDGSSGTASHGHNVAKEGDVDKKNESCNVASSFTVEPICSQAQASGDANLNEAFATSSFSLVDNCSQETCGFREENDKTSSATTPAGSGIPFIALETLCDPSCLKTSLFTGLTKKPEFIINGRSKGRKRSEKLRQRSKHSSSYIGRPKQEGVKDSIAQEDLSFQSCYSPMDFSPYEETNGVEDHKETCVTSNDTNPLKNVPSAFQSTVANFNEGNEACNAVRDDQRPSELDEERSENHSKSFSDANYPSKGFVFGSETTCFGSNGEKVCCTSHVADGVTENTHDLGREKDHKIQFSFTSGLEDMDEKKFSFSASSSVQNSSTAAKRMPRKKYRKKHPSEPLIVASSPNVDKAQEGDVHASQGKMASKSEVIGQGPISSYVTVEEACEMWRMRGNQAYENGDLSNAEDFYTRGINSVSAVEISGCFLKPLVICYSNRAATRISLGNLREALRDCLKAATLDPNFLKVYLRAAKCHLMLGEAENAQHYFTKCLENGGGVCLDRRIAIEAADGLQKAQKVAECQNRSAQLLEQRTSEVAVTALDAISEALSVSPFSEKLLEMKAESLFMLRNFKEVIQLCEKTLSAAEKNFASVGDDNCIAELDGSVTEIYSVPRVWRWHLMSKSYFYLGKLEMALDILQTLEEMGSTIYKCASKVLESSVTLAATINNLLHHKNAGNEAVLSGRYIEAIEHYTGALSSNIESRPFAAICFSNRAAAYQALGQIADAIADCSLAIALDGSYSKAVSRRAALHEMIRDYGQAAIDLQRLISILEKQNDGKPKHNGTPGRSSSRKKELRQARQHLSLMEEEAKKRIPLDLYCILGVKDSDSASDIKKAYRKAALRHHPDKAGQFLARSESGDDGQLWKGIIQDVHIDADRLFKMIGEAYAVLSDPAKRSDYDLDEEIRKASKEMKGNGYHRKKAETQSYPYERSDVRRNWQGYWKTHTNSHSRW
ncbi:hypothetical protein Tsubulata_009302 [Turnera subulata]|uniref:J domain-containing protein n=1 Tax=Turnera subulata TaxID=218843 RepID=A0A9Q0J797_9ROSI|nr:hypothetical protein Tsubulata_009302 [Turnera subulata]